MLVCARRSGRRQLERRRQGDGEAVRALEGDSVIDRGRCGGRDVGIALRRIERL